MPNPVNHYFKKKLRFIIICAKYYEYALCIARYYHYGYLSILRSFGLLIIDPIFVPFNIILK